MRSLPDSDCCLHGRLAQSCVCRPFYQNTMSGHFLSISRQCVLSAGASLCPAENSVCTGSQRSARQQHFVSAAEPYDPAASSHAWRIA